MRNPILTLLIFLLIPAIAFAVEVGKPAPGFTLETPDGQSVSLADYKGKVVLLKLATTWCPSCKELSKNLVAIGDFLKEKDVVLIEVYIQDTPDMVESYDKGMVYPMTRKVLIDDRQVYDAYRIFAIPRFLVVDREQKVRFDNAPSAAIPPAEEIRKLVESAL